MVASIWTPRASEACNGVDQDMDLHTDCTDCDDTDPTVHPGAAEVCDGVDNDCDGWLGTTAQVPPWSPGVSHGGDGLFANHLVVTAHDVVPFFSMYVYASTWTVLDWVVYERTGATGDFTRIATATTWSDSASFGWLTSPTLDIAVVPGNEYLFGIEPSVPVSVTYAFGGNAAWTTTSMGAFLGAVYDTPGGATVPGTVFLGGNLFSQQLYFAAEVDEDLDGFPGCDDCDDDDPAVFPGAVEICNGIDDDCDGVLLPSEDDPTYDVDGDGWSFCGGDCDDADPAIHPDAPEICNGIDDDCDGLLGAGLESVDDDGDGMPPCVDCDDADPGAYEGAVEVCDGVDNDCDGVVDPGGDQDLDGWSACAECDDGDPSVNPDAAELCDGVDNDCDGALMPDEVDADGDGAWVCLGDCDDDDPAMRPGLVEICDGLDNDCDGVVGMPPVFESDADGDGSRTCEGDCDDEDPSVSPDLPEDCDGVDSDCDPSTTGDEDADRDGFSVCVGDCDDADPGRSPGRPELCNGIDDDCDGEIVGEEDEDGDGAAVCDGDCDDLDASRGPGRTELCDGVDSDCSAGGVRHEFTGDMSANVPAGRYGVRVHVADRTVLDGFSVQVDTFDPDVVFEVWSENDLGAVELLFEGDPTSEFEGGRLRSEGIGVPLSPRERYVLAVRLPREQRLLLREGEFPESDRDVWTSGGVHMPYAALGEDPRFGDLSLVVRLGTPDERDRDGDGVAACEGDCDDVDATIHPGAEDVCDAQDRDCDGEFPNCPPAVGCSQAPRGSAVGLLLLLPLVTRRRLIVLAVAAPLLATSTAWAQTCDDLDGDGYEDDLCGGEDCDDADPTVFPGAFELCDGVDTACDGATTTTFGPYTMYVSGGGPRSRGNHVTVVVPTSLGSFGIRLGGTVGSQLTWTVTEFTPGTSGGLTVATATSAVQNTGVMTHMSPSLNVPLSPSKEYVLAVYMAGQTSVEWTSVPALPWDAGQYSLNGGFVYGAPINPWAVPAPAPYLYVMELVTAPEDDDDGDGVIACGGDCDDQDPARAPGLAEVCDAVDNDCDGLVPGDELDLDGDGLTECDGDCGPMSATIPGPVELCDGMDTDCDGTLPADEVDGDGDWYRPCDGDCDDTDYRVNPGAWEECNNRDDDCDGVLGAWETTDADGDGYTACDDCNDYDANQAPGLAEVCDGLDNDCDWSTPNSEWDYDWDGWMACEECDDRDDRRHPGATERCNGVDDDCDDEVDEGCPDDDAESGDPRRRWGDIVGMPPEGEDRAGCSEPRGCSSVGAGGGGAWLLLAFLTVRRRDGNPACGRRGRPSGRMRD